MGTESVARQTHQKTVQLYWVNIDKQQVMRGAGSQTQRHDNSTNGGGFESNNILTQAQALLGKAIGEHPKQHNAEVKSIINKDCQMAPKRMPLGTRLVVNTHNMGGRFVESAKNARWTMSPQGGYIRKQS